MLEKWSEFYIMIGGAAAGLIGLLFIVVTLSAASEAAQKRENLAQGHQVYASPTMFHLVIILVISATALAPDLNAVFSASVLSICAILGLLYIRWVFRQFQSPIPPPGFERMDLWLYGFVPGLFYAVLLVVSILIGARLRFAAQLLGLTTICLLLITINNAWDLAGWLAHPLRKQRRQKMSGKNDSGTAA